MSARLSTGHVAPTVFARALTAGASAGALNLARTQLRPWPRAPDYMVPPDCIVPPDYRVVPEAAGGAAQGGRPLAVCAPTPKRATPKVVARLTDAALPWSPARRRAKENFDSQRAHSVCPEAGAHD